MEVVARAAWRRLDEPGQDRCALLRSGGGWRLEGEARFGASRLAYRVEYAPDWSTVRAEVSGSWACVVERRPEEWWQDGRAVGLGGLLDIDFGFTPATNLSQIRRLGLGVGEAAELTVAWLDEDMGAPTALLQRYRRTGEATYAYESPSAGYAATLELDPATGFVTRYPGLWESESG